MCKWWRHAVLECRLLFGNPVFASLPVIYAILFAMNMLNSGGGTEQNLYTMAYKFHMLGHTMTLGPAMLIGILSMRRDVLRRSFEWNHSLPVSFLTLLSSKYAVSMLYLSLFTLPTAFIFYTISISQGIAGGIAMHYTMQFAMQYEISYMVTLALAMVLGASIPNRIVYLIGFCAWMFGTFFMDIFIITQLGWYPAEVFHLNQFFIQSEALQYENWSYALISADISRSRWFVLAFTGLLLAVSLLLLNRKRPTMHVKRIWAAAVAALVLAGAIFMPYGSLWAERYEQLGSKLSDPSIGLTDDPVPATIFTVSSYDLELKRLPNDNLRVTARLRIPAGELAGKSELPLTLNRFFTLERVRIQGNDAPYRRRGEMLTISLPANSRQEIEAELVYFGSVMDYRTDYSRNDFAAFSLGDEVKLEGHMAWYPLPGHQHVYLKQVETSSPYITLARRYGIQRYSVGDMKLKVEGYSKPLYSSLKEVERGPGYQIFESKGIGQNVSLYGGSFWTEVHRPDFKVRIVTTPYLEKWAEGLLTELKGKYDYFAAWIPGMSTDIGTILCLGQGIEWPHAEHSLILSSREYTYFSSNLPGEWVNYMLFGDQPAYYGNYEHPEQDVRNKIGSLFWYVYYIEEKGLSDKQLRSAYGHLRSVQELLFKNGDGTDPQNKIGIGMARQVRRAMKEGKAEQVKKVLAHYYGHGLQFPDTERYPAMKPEAPVTYEEWVKRWKQTVGE